MNLLLNLTANAFDPGLAVWIVPWGWLVFVGHCTYLFLAGGWFTDKAILFRGVFGKRVRLAVLSYIVVATAFAMLGVLYWATISRTYAALSARSMNKKDAPAPQSNAVAEPNPSPAILFVQVRSEGIAQIFERADGMDYFIFEKLSIENVSGSSITLDLTIHVRDIILRPTRRSKSAPWISETEPELGFPLTLAARGKANSKQSGHVIFVTRVPGPVAESSAGISAEDMTTGFFETRETTFEINMTDKDTGLSIKQTQSTPVSFELKVARGR